VVAYYSGSAGSVRKNEAPSRVAKGLASHPIGVILLARLALNRREQETGLGKALFVVLCRARPVQRMRLERALFWSMPSTTRRFGFTLDLASNARRSIQGRLLMKDLRICCDS
jgi:hypothetical protein